jgi:hypothetical protein
VPAGETHRLVAPGGAEDGDDLVGAAATIREAAPERLELGA